MKLAEFYELIKDVCSTYHYESDCEDFPRQVYTEYASTYEYASNHVYNKTISINLDHYSKKEFDETEKILEILLMLEKEITFNKETTFDEETKVITNSYDIEIYESIDEAELRKELKDVQAKQS